MINRMIDELMKLKYTVDSDNYSWETEVIDGKNKKLVSEALLRVYIEEGDHSERKIAGLEAKVYAYEKIIANSNFRSFIEEGEYNNG